MNCKLCGKNVLVADEFDKLPAFLHFGQIGNVADERQSLSGQGIFLFKIGHRGRMVNGDLAALAFFSEIGVERNCEYHAV